MRSPRRVFFLGLIFCCAGFVVIEHAHFQSTFLSSENPSPVVPEMSSENALIVPKTLNCKRMNLQLADAQRSVVASLGQGRLGNQMGNFASCYSVMKDYGMYPYLNTMQLNLLENVFVLPELVDSDNASYYIWEEGTFIIFHDKYN